jgi:DNA-binding transcriptional ArsR family regulator
MAEQLEAGEMSLTQLAEPYDITMPAVMKHLAVLERSGIVLTEKRGRVRYCRLEPKQLEVAEEWLRQRSQLWSNRLASLDKYLQENP